MPEWETLSADERRLFARYMEVFAGFVTHTDHHLGRLFDHLDEIGIADDTLVMILSDNGASAEGGPTGTLNEAAGWLGFNETVEDALEHIDEIGGHDANNHYPYGWAWAGNAPLRLWKRYAWLGGVRTPLVVRWGDRLVDPGGRAAAVLPRDRPLHDGPRRGRDLSSPDSVDGVTAAAGRRSLDAAAASPTRPPRSTAACSTSR